MKEEDYKLIARVFKFKREVFVGDKEDLDTIAIELAMAFRQRNPKGFNSDQFLKDCGVKPALIKPATEVANLKDAK